MTMMINKNKVDYSQFPDNSIPVYYSLKKGFLTYTGQIIPRNLKRKVYFMSPERASKVLDLVPYQGYLNGDITKCDSFIHRDYGKKMDFTRLNRAVFTNLRIGDESSIQKIYLDLLKNFPWTNKKRPPEKKKVKVAVPVEIIEDIPKKFNTDLAYRFDLDFSDSTSMPNSQSVESSNRFDLDFD